MRVLVLGAGVTGITSAYYLAERGYEVTVLDRGAEAALGASYANGGQLSYSFTDALARPAFLRAMPGLLLGRDGAVRIRPWRRPWLAAWSLLFLRQCTARRARANTLAVLELALRSRNRLAGIREATGIDFSHADKGKLVLLPAGADLQEAAAGVTLKNRHGCSTELLALPDARALEPALEGFPDDYAAAIFSASDETGDARLYTRELAAWLGRRRGVTFRFDETVQRLFLDGGRCRGVVTDRGDIASDAVVVSLGNGSPSVLRTAGVRAPIYPVRGYSLTLPHGSAAPAISITDLARRVLFCPLGNAMRVSGFADFVGNDDRDDDARVQQLGELAESIAPAAADYAADERHPWAGARPMTPDGRPLTGATGVPGLFLNCGHGMLGWTLAAATAHDAAEALTQQLGRPGQTGRT